MKLFALMRTEDESGVSGVGVVAEGVQFTNGKCALSWLTEHSSVAVYDDIATLEAIHGHNGKTQIVWMAKDLVEAMDRLRFDRIPEADPPGHWIPVCEGCGARWRGDEGFVEEHRGLCVNDRYGWNFVRYVDPATHKKQEA